ncbi:hypothetical protein Trydic_g13567, partial [Trypoxylus dichotomus]
QNIQFLPLPNICKQSMRYCIEVTEHN